MRVLDTVDAEAIRALHERGEFFWLDLRAPTDAELDTLGDLVGNAVEVADAVPADSPFEI